LCEHDAAVIDVLALKDFGVRLALDRFGSGQSHLAYLRQLPFDQIKIDCSFIQHFSDDLHSSAIVLAIARLAESFGIESVSVGIETESRARLLAEAGCKLGQG
jgi:EAL domain-containing protein (putative c-di-GMP-specific phosphodiesterase class I)